MLSLNKNISFENINLRRGEVGNILYNLSSIKPLGGFLFKGYVRCLILAILRLAKKIGAFTHHYRLLKVLALVNTINKRPDAFSQQYNVPGDGFVCM